MQHIFVVQLHTKMMCDYNYCHCSQVAWISTVIATSFYAFGHLCKFVVSVTLTSELWPPKKKTSDQVHNLNHILRNYLVMCF